MPSLISAEDISIGALKRAISIREQIEALQQQHKAILGDSGADVSTPATIRRGRGRPRKSAVVESAGAKVDGRKGKRSAATRARMAAAQRARWAAKKG